MNRAGISLPQFLHIPAFSSPFGEKILSMAVGHQYFGPYRHEITRAAMASSFRLCLGRNELGCNQSTFIPLGSSFCEKILSTTIGHQYFGPYRHEITRAAMASSFRLCLGR